MIRVTGAEAGATMAMTRLAATMLPNPMLISRGSMRSSVCPASARLLDVLDLLPAGFHFTLEGNRPPVTHAAAPAPCPPPPPPPPAPAPAPAAPPPAPAAPPCLRPAAHPLRRASAADHRALRPRCSPGRPTGPRRPRASLPGGRSRGRPATAGG